MNEFKNLKENNLIKNNYKQDNQSSDSEAPNYFDEIDLADDPEILRLELKKKYLYWTGGTILDEKFSNFNQDSPENIKNYKIVKNYCENIDNPDSPTHLFILGGVGTGKSHLIKSSVNYFIDNRIGGKYFLYPEMRLQLLNFDENVAAKIQSFIDIKILVIDEMYMGYDKTGYVKQNFDDILLARWERKRPTLVTGNIKPKQLEDHIRDRFFDDSMTLRINTWDQKSKRPDKKAI